VTDRPLERGAQRGRQGGGGHLDAREGDGRGGRALDVEVQAAAQEATEAGLSAWVNETSSSPQPHHFMAGTR